MKKELKYEMQRKLAEQDELIKTVENENLKEAQDEYSELLRKLTKGSLK